jgi:protein-disulfide isomerase
LRDASPGVSSFRACRRFQTCLGSGDVEGRIQAGRSLADQLGITATPTVFLNGWRYPVPPTEVELSRAISAILNGAPPFPN